MSLLWRSAFRNFLPGYLCRKPLRFGDTCAIQAEAEDLLADNEHEVESRRVLQLARDSARTACDCEFAAQAKRLDATLVTMDEKSLRAFP